MSEVWEDLGFRGRMEPKAKDSKAPVDCVNLKNRLSGLGAKIINEAGAGIHVEIMNRRAYLWPRSDCYFLEAKSKYGRGIEKWLDDVEGYLKQMQPHSK